MLAAARLGSLLTVLASTAAAQQVEWFQSPINQHWYGVEYKTTSWTQGEAEAVSLGGHLATIRSQAEQDWIESEFQFALLPAPGGIWMGLTDAGHEGTWVWTSGEPVTYLPWYAGQPQGGTTENSGILVGSGSGFVAWSWHDAPDNWAASRSLIELDQLPGAGWSWPTSYPTGTDPQYHCVADMDADGLPDLIVPHYNAASIAVVRNLGQGQFAPWASFSTLAGAVAVQAADFDHDGHMDIAVAAADGQAVRIHRGDGLGGFVVGQTISLGVMPLGLASADFNADGWADIAFTTLAGASGVHVALNDGSGVLLAGTALASQQDPNFISLADVNADGKIDMVVSNSSSSSVGTYLNNGAGVFAPAIYSDCGSNPHHVGVGDFNRDGRVDLAVPNWNAGAVTILTGDGTGLFTPVAGFFPIGSSAWIDVGDVDGDELPDLVFGHGTSTAISVHLGNGTTTFGSPIMLAGPNWVRSVVLADLDSNGTLDISATGYQSGDVAVILNQAIPPHFTKYCTAGTTTHGCVASIRAAGTPSASAGSGFDLICAYLEANQSGIIFYGLSGAKADPWGQGTSFLCVKYPVERTGTLTSGVSGGACGGVLSIDWNQFIATHPGALGNPFVGGETVWAQGWFRDPPSPKTTNMSDALTFVVEP